MELSLEEVLKAVELGGFRLRVINPSPKNDPNSTDTGAEGESDWIEERTRVIPCEYTADKRAMMKWVYEARFWIAEKI